jgi:predicted ATPase/DNA-binding CsgD family transcriptional regulator
MQDCIGRQSELAGLHVALARSLAGHAQVVLLTGEAGIGKTRIALALADIALQDSALVLWGACLEDPGAPAYWPWLQTLRQFAQSHDDATLCAALGRGASCIAQIWPDLGERLPGLASTQPISHPAQARFRVFDAIAQLWRRAADVQPLVLILEDLHWADTPSLQLLQFVAAEVGAARILVLATFRDEPGPAARPVLCAQIELLRRSNVQRLALTGLHPEHTARLIEAITGCLPTRSASALVYAKTSGNPLLVAEIARYLAREGRLTTDVPPDGTWHVPAEIRALIAMRWERVSAATQRVLGVAAVIGARFNIGLLRRVLPDQPAEAVFSALEEALSAGLIEHAADSGNYRFGHVLTRDALYDQLPAVERARTHERVGTVLETDHRHHIAPQVALLAHHFIAALPAGASAKAVAYAVDAAEQACARLAFEEAVRWLSLARNAMESSAPVPATMRCKLIIALGNAHTKAGQLPAALEALTEAAREAAHLGATNELTQAAIDFEEATWRLASSSERAVSLLKHALAQLSSADETSRTRLRSALVRAQVFAGSSTQARTLCDETVAQARRSGEPQGLQAALRSRFWMPWQPEDLETLLAAAHETLALAEQSGNAEQMLDACAFRLHLLAATGDMHGFDTDLHRFAQLADELQQPFHRYHAGSMQAARALASGNLAQARSLADAAFKLGTRLPGLNPAGAYGIQMFSIARERGELRELAPQVTRFVDSTADNAIWQPALALILAELGEHDAALARLAQLAEGQFRGIVRDSLWLISITYLAEACGIVRAHAAAAELYRLLAPWSGRNVVAGAMVVCCGPVDRFLGMLCVVLERWDSAERHFEAALASSVHPDTRPWLAHAQFQYAGMLLERGRADDRQRACALLQDARLIAEDLGMSALQAHARQLAHTVDAHARTPAYPGGLSNREAQVLRLVAAGKSNQQIADALFRSPNTVANHVRSILAKLGTANRAEAAAFAARHGLL